MKSANRLDIFGSTFACECGRTHAVEPRRVIYEAGAVERLPHICASAAPGRRVAVLMDVRTRDVAGAEAYRALADAGWQVAEIIVPDPAPGRSPVCDDVTREKLLPRVREADLLVAAGSGVVTDLSRWCALEMDVPFVSIPTAASMNGYCSANVAPTIGGVKSLLWARTPAAVAADPSVIEGAPPETTASGLGDVLAKSVSAGDWRMNSLLFGDYYCPRAVGLIADIEPLYMDRPEALKASDPDAVEALFSALLLTGAAMTMAGTSSPASGGEHNVSHALDMMSLLDGAEHDLHGRQVGVGTVLASELYRRVLAVESPQFTEPVESVDEAFWGRLANVVGDEYAGKVDRLRLARGKLASGDTWDRLREGVAPLLRGPATVRDCLARADAAHRAEDIGCDHERLLAAFLHAHEMRARLTVLDLARLLGIMPGSAREIVETWT